MYNNKKQHSQPTAAFEREMAFEFLNDGRGVKMRTGGSEFSLTDGKPVFVRSWYPTEEGKDNTWYWNFLSSRGKISIAQFRGGLINYNPQAMTVGNGLLLIIGGSRLSSRYFDISVGAFMDLLGLPKTSAENRMPTSNSYMAGTAFVQVRMFDFEGVEQKSGPDGSFMLEPSVPWLIRYRRIRNSVPQEWTRVYIPYDWKYVPAAEAVAKAPVQLAPEKEATPPPLMQPVINPEAAAALDGLKLEDEAIPEAPKTEAMPVTPTQPEAPAVIPTPAPAPAVEPTPIAASQPVTTPVVPEKTEIKIEDPAPQAPVINAQPTMPAPEPAAVVIPVTPSVPEVSAPPEQVVVTPPPVDVTPATVVPSQSTAASPAADQGLLHINVQQ